ncbi:hypothetical protein [Rhodopseudomonas sp. B29]|uniref:hypothetical protein n=1 Tax=Rhodopseudomonas sp. B29 TaxID=95607 RepID=UPI0011D2A683|nr:hypothetical protein [Rhodopseudomonas sp. B29]
METSPRFRRALTFAAVALAIGSIAMVTQAEAQYSATPEQRRACTPDVYRLCAGEIPNRARITACLKRQRESLSEACRAVFMH